MGPIERLRRIGAVRRHLEQRREALYRLAFAWCNDPCLADDLVQQAAAKALQGAGQLRGVERVDRWVVRIMANCWRDHLRRAGREVPEDILPHAHAEPATPEWECEREATVERVRSAMMRIPPAQREVVALVDLEGYSYAEAADALGIPVGTVMSRLCRARRALRGLLLEERGSGAGRPAPRGTVTVMRRVK